MRDWTGSNSHECASLTLMSLHCVSPNELSLPFTAAATPNILSFSIIKILSFLHAPTPQSPPLPAQLNDLISCFCENTIFPKNEKNRSQQTSSPHWDSANKSVTSDQHLSFLHFLQGLGLWGGQRLDGARPPHPEGRPGPPEPAIA